MSRRNEGVNSTFYDELPSAAFPRIPQPDETRNLKQTHTTVIYESADEYQLANDLKKKKIIPNEYAILLDSGIFFAEYLTQTAADQAFYEMAKALAQKKT